MNARTTNQTTVYTYGTTLTESAITTSILLLIPVGVVCVESLGWLVPKRRNLPQGNLDKMRMFTRQGSSAQLATLQRTRCACELAKRSESLIQGQ